MKDKEIIDEDHFYVSRGNTTTRLTGKRIKDRINKIKKMFNNTNEINTDSNITNEEEGNIIEEEEPKNIGFYNKFVKVMGKDGWFKNLLSQKQPEEKALEAKIPNVNFFQKE